MSLFPHSTTQFPSLHFPTPLWITSHFILWFNSTGIGFGQMNNYIYVLSYVSFLTYKVGYYKYYYAWFFFFYLTVYSGKNCKELIIGKDPDAGKDWRQEEKGLTEDEMVGWHHRLDGHWASSGTWWRTGKPGIPQSMRLQRVRYDWVTELNWYSGKHSR